ncbi:MAG: glycosyltransferase family 61 protein [Candidatus Thiodiazotropha sp. (ex Monitilora ramsayi)]|nr:glycosyltransferase family 61 protein [Candidatus Thiodiazotropha sp. (ex Monitilora ramsayi)]
MSDILKHRINRLIFTPVRLVYFVISCFFVFFQWRQFEPKNGETSFEYWNITLRIFKGVIVPRRGTASFRRLSVPISSFCQSFPGKTWDSTLFREWYLGKEKPLSKLTLKDKSLYFYANLAGRVGDLYVAWQIFDYLSDKKEKNSQVVGLLGKMDLSILISMWREQLNDFYKLGIWLNADEIDGYEDNISPLMTIVEDGDVDKLYEKLIKIAPKLSVVHEMYGEYAESVFNVNDAKAAYNNAISVNPDNRTALRRHSMLERFLSDVEVGQELAPFINPVVANIVSAKELCDKFDWKYYELSKKENLNYKIGHVVNEKYFERDVSLDIPSHSVAHCSNVIVLGGGLVLSHHNADFNIVRDSKHLDIRHLKLFVPQVVTHNDQKALIQIPPNLGKEICESAFAITGSGWNYYHWMYEAIPYLDLYEKSGCNSQMPLYFPFNLKRWHIDTLRLLGRDSSDIVKFKSHSMLFKNCAFPTHSSRDTVPSPSAIRYLRERFSRHSIVKPGKRVYLTRRGVNAVRGMKNLATVSEWMNKNGFVQIDPLSMSIEEQIEFFSDVEMVAAEGGAALSNLVFCPERTKVLVIAASRAWAETFSAIAGELGQRMISVLGESQPKPMPYYIWTAYDYTIRHEDLDVALEQLC